jgi:hypothetical protein
LGQRRPLRWATRRVAVQRLLVGEQVGPGSQPPGDALQTALQVAVTDGPTDLSEAHRPQIATLPPRRTSTAVTLPFIAHTPPTAYPSDTLHARYRAFENGLDDRHERWCMSTNTPIAGECSTAASTIGGHTCFPTVRVPPRLNERPAKRGTRRVF